MPQVVFVRAFAHCVRGAIYPTTFEPSDAPVTVDEETARIAIQEGRAVPFVERNKENGPPSPVSGPAPQSPSSEPDQAPRKNRRWRSGGKRA